MAGPSPPHPAAAAADNPDQSAYNDPGNLSAPSGQCPMCIGGAVVSGGVYSFSHQDDFDWGAVGGFLAPAGTGLAAQLGLQGGRALAVATVTDAAVGMGKPAWGALKGLRLFPPKVKASAHISAASDAARNSIPTIIKRTKGRTYNAAVDTRTGEIAVGSSGTVREGAPSYCAEGNVRNVGGLQACLCEVPGGLS
ncbi:hypothetical protein ACFY1L_12430 [Streptomyces sp. NPDC001663]|uniref:hypothetical protein n=1 Tax=Streptomyces sp. NPDC001663 TaxID=3364597 RepID=UPI0036AF01DD